MNTSQLAIRGCLTLAVAGLASAVSAGTTYDEAKVLASTPIYHMVESTVPQRVCKEEEVAVRDRSRESRDSATPEILGAVIGGALGNALGNHSANKAVGAVVGAVVGGSVAHDIDNANHDSQDTVRTEVVERCHTVATTHQEEKLVGYDVRYSYNGSEHTVRMDHDPGATVKVRVDVEPVRQ